MSELRHPDGSDGPEATDSPVSPVDRSEPRPALSDAYVDDDWDTFRSGGEEAPADSVHPGVADTAEAVPPGSTDLPRPQDGPETPDTPETPDEPEDGARHNAITRVCDRLDITDPTAIDALGRAYDVAREHTAPFVVKAAADMLDDLKPLTEDNPDRRVVYVGRDGHGLALAARALDPEWFDRSATEAVLSRAVAETAVQDLERNAGKSFPQLDAFRGAASKVNPDDVTGARERLADYLHAHGVPISEPGSEVTLVDSSYKGTVQELLAAVYPTTQFDGRYLFHAPSPSDPHPGSKKGYVLHLDAAHGNGGIPVPDLPDDPALTFSHQDAIGVIEETLHGPWSSPRRITSDGPEQQREPPSLRGLNPARVAEEFTDPVTREGVMDINLRAVVDYARHVATMRDSGQDWRAELDQAAGRFPDQVRGWVSGQPADGQFAAVMDSFVRRADKAEVDVLADAINQAGLPADTSNGVWQTYDQLTTLDDKRDFAARYAAEHERDGYSDG